jgi:hypothetical protein
MKLLDILKLAAVFFAICLFFMVYTKSSEGSEGNQGSQGFVDSAPAAMTFNKQATKYTTATTPSPARKATEAEAAALDKKLAESQDAFPYSTDPIKSVDDYEYTAIFAGEGDKALTKEKRDVLMSAYPMDWSTQPPSSELFQQGLAAFKEQFENPAPQAKGNTGNPFREVDGSNMTPPDSSAEEAKEREILATYVPKKPGELTTYDAADAQELITRIYSAKGLVADTKKTGDNVFTIVGTRKVNEPVVYEPEEEHAPTSSGAVAAVGENTIDVPATVEQIQSVDPFFETTARDKSRGDKWDYTSWTPGLERMFAPTQPKEKWY